MSNEVARAGGQPPRSTAWQTALTVVQEVTPPVIPEQAEVMTVIVKFPPGDPGTPPHRHPGPAFGYMLEGEMLFVVTMMCVPGKPMLTLVDDDEFARRKDRRPPQG